MFEILFSCCSRYIIFLALLFSVSVFAEPGKTRVDMIVEADYVVTMDAEGTVIEKGAVAIKDGELVGVGMAKSIAHSFEADENIRGDNRVIMPGLINGHTHAAMTLFRGVADDLAIMEWLTKYIFPAEIKFVDEEFVRIGTQLACLEMIRSGTTAVVDMYFHPKEIAKVIDECGIRAVIGAAVIEQESGYTRNFEDAMTKAEDFIKEWKDKNNRIFPAIAAHAAFTVSPENLKHVRDRANALGVPAAIHLSESKAEVDEVIHLYGKSPGIHLEGIGFFTGPTIGAHVVWPTDDEIPILARRGVGVIHNPTSNLKVASGISPVPEMLAAGVIVGLGTDGAASNNDLDMWDEIKLASLIHKGRMFDPKIMPATTVLGLATSLGARAIGLDSMIGMLTVGKRADLILISLDHAHHVPLYNIVSHLVYTVDAEDVETVIVEGKILMRDRKVLTLDEAKIIEAARAIGSKVKAELYKE